METSNRLGAYCSVTELEVSLLPNSTTYCLTRGDSIGLSASSRSTSAKQFVYLLYIQFGVQASALSLLAVVLLTLVLLVCLSPSGFMWGTEAHALFTLYRFATSSGNLFLLRISKWSLCKHPFAFIYTHY
jgi:hypothetical protein